MMLKLGKLGSALVLGCFLCVALFSTGAFAQSASYSMANNASQRMVGHVWHGVAKPRGWGHGGFVRVTRMIRVSKLVRVTRFIRVVKLIRVTKFIHVTHWIRVTQFRRVGCGGGC